MKNKISIVISSRVKKEEKINLLENIKKTCGCDYELFFIQNNGNMSLSKLYSSMFVHITNPIIVFIHDDIEFLSENWGVKLLKIFDENQDYGIIGVAGSNEFNENGKWWCNQNTYGQVFHQFNNDIWLSDYGHYLNNKLYEACVIDGLFIAINKEKQLKNFDESLDGFHMYDIDFCLNNYINKTCKIGITLDIILLHKSLGIINDNWFNAKEKIINKYKKFIPIKYGN